MGASLLWTLRFILFFVVICKQTTGDRATLDVPQHTVFLEERVTLICTGQDGKQLQFYKDGSLVQRDTQHLLLQGLNKAYLKMDFVSKSNEGLYSCGANEETHSPEKELKVTENTRRIELTVSNTDIPVGGSVTLSCDVEDWNGELQLLSVKAEDDSEIQNLGKEQTLSVTDRGVYYCRPWDRHVSTKRSNDVTVVDTAPTVSVSQLVFVGESLTLRCEVEGGADTEWTYHWSRNRLNLPPTTREYTVSSVTESDTGTYSCRAQRGPHHTTVWSTNTSVTVLSAPKGDVSSLSVMWIIGPVCAVVLLILLLLLWRFSKTKGESATYAQVNHHKKERPKAASCSACDDTVYSQIKETNGAFTLSPLQH